MSMRSLRLGLAGSLVLLAVIAVAFYYRQNTGEHIGGAISLPKMLWLAYAVAAWFVVPPFLWRDSRLQSGVRRLFGVFWAWMLGRGAIELVLLFVFVHWNPLYGVTWNVIANLLLAWFRRGLKPEAV